MSKYDRIICGISNEGQPMAVTVDVYDVLSAFSVTDPALQHLIKKALCTGIRGHKNRETDLNEILQSAKRAVDMHAQNIRLSGVINAISISQDQR